MRQAFVACETQEEADKRFPWACIVVEVPGGFMAFETMKDYQTWKLHN